MALRLLTAAALIALPSAAAPVLAQAMAPSSATMPAPSAATFVKKAGASDLFEIDSARLMQASSNAQIRQFAQKMMTDHAKSTAMVKAAARKAGMTVAPPMLDAMQKADLAKLRAAKGAARDALYVSQQKTAHAQALELMRSYASGGRPGPLRDAAGEIAPVVQTHIDMIDRMPAM